MTIAEDRTRAAVQLDNGIRLTDTSGESLDLPTPWAPVRVRRADVDAAIERLVDAPAPANGRRSTAVVHPESTGRGFAPGIEVTIEVLLPGERTTPVRRNSTLVQIGIRGSGTVEVADRRIALDLFDVCNIPSMKPHTFTNTGTEPWVRLAYSNAPLLALLGTHYSEGVAEDWAPTPSVDGPIDMDEPGEFNRGTAPDHLVSDTGARLRGYEFLVDIEPVPNRPLHWPYTATSALMSQTLGDRERTIMALYNPATERKQGATGSFFVTLSQFPAGLPAKPVGRGHRHSSVAINYHFAGSGYSVVDGERIDWEAGDLLLSAPSWREHDHHIGSDGASVYTVQDHPLHIGMESLVWQEDMDGPILALGADAGLTGYVGPRQTGS